MGHAKKITAITLTILLVTVTLLGSGWITQTVSAIDLDTAIDLEAAPHFRDLTYTVGAPTYSTSFDAMGDWKVSTGNPRLSIDRSNLVVTAPSASPVRVSLTSAYAEGLNVPDERSTVQLKVAPGNVTTQYTNVTLAANIDASDHITVSFNHGEANVVYTNGATSTSALLYSPVVKGTSYIIAYELAESGATVYLYDAASGDLLANKLLDVADVHAGTVYALHMGVSGLASGTLRADYAFVTTASTDTSGVKIEMESLAAPDAREASIVQVDPTKLKMIRSDDPITSSAYGMDSLLSEDDDVANFFGTIGSTAEPSQRFQGHFVAVGWEDFRGEVEAQLRSQIAKGLGIVDYNQIYIVDYYIDYLQLKTSMDQTIVNNELAEYRKGMIDAFANMGINLTATDAAVVSHQYTSVPMVSYGSATMAILPPGATAYALDWVDLAASLNPITLAVNYFTMSEEEKAEYRAKVGAFSILDGVNIDFPKSIPDALGLPDADDAKDLVKELTGSVNETLIAMAEWTLKAIREGWAGAFEFCNMTYLNLYNTFTAETARWNAVLNSTMDQFAAMAKETMATMTGFFDATVNEISSKYEKMNQQLASLNAEYMNWSNAMMVNTNAMFTQLLYDLSEQSAETQRYFMDQVAKGNEAVANISDSIALNAQQANAIFADLLSNGKLTEGEGLSFGAFLGDESTTVTIILVVAISLVAVVGIIYLMSGRKKVGRKRR